MSSLISQNPDTSRLNNLDKVMSHDTQTSGHPISVNFFGKQMSAGLEIHSSGPYDFTMGRNFHPSCEPIIYWNASKNHAFLHLEMFSEGNFTSGQQSGNTDQSLIVQ